MKNIREAAEMALEVMEYNRANGTPNMGAAIEALRQALAQPEQEPVAWVYNGILHEFDPSEFATSEVTPLYIAPPISDYHEGWEEGFKAAKREWVSLTDEDVKALPEWFPSHATSAVLPLVRAVQAKLKEKNSG